MRKVVSNRRYDTDTARLVGVWETGSYPGDPGFITAGLYCKRTGEYFLSWASPAPPSFTHLAEDIVPLSFPQARDWAEEHLDAGVFHREFCGRCEGEEVISVRVPARVRAALLDEVARTGRTQSEIVSECILAGTRRREAAGGYDVALGTAGRRAPEAAGLDGSRDVPGVDEGSVDMEGRDVLEALGIRFDSTDEASLGDVFPHTEFECGCSVCGNRFVARADELLAGAACPRCRPETWDNISERAAAAWV